MNANQLAGILRIIIPVILVWVSGAVGKSLAPEDAASLTEYVINAFTAVVTLGAVVWSWWRNTRTAQIRQVANLPEVRKIVAEPYVANVALRDASKVVTE